MKFVLREDESGVSEVVGTILILAMTVVLFSSIILWVSNIPTPVAQTRVDIQGALNPVFDANGNEVRDYINLTHQGGESLPAASTEIYVSDQKGNAAPTTDVIHLALFKNLGKVGYGLLDGAGTSWSVGQRFSYVNTTMRSSDKITVTVVDTFRSIVLWTSTLNPPAGSRPSIFLNVYAARNNFGTPLPVQTGTGFYLFAQIMAPDNNLNPNSVFATITYYYTNPGCDKPNGVLQMYDDGPDGGHGDAVAGDNLYTIFENACTGNTYSGMDGSIVLLNATTMPSAQYPHGLQTTTRMILHVVPGPTGTTNPNGTYGGSGRPPNLLWNGNQGYNIFNASQWDNYGYAATPTRTFKGTETIVVVVGSLSLENVFSGNTFDLWDPYSGSPAQAVVYGVTKAVGSASMPSTTSAFTFFQFVNGYYIYTFRFTLNTATQTNFYTTPPQYPRYYWYAKYPLSMLLGSSTGTTFSAADSVNITSPTGQMRTFPVLQTFSDPGYTQPSNYFTSTQTIYVQVQMLTANANGSGEIGTVYFGNIEIQDFAGNLQLNRAPTNGIYANLPICAPNGVCSSSTIAIQSTQSPAAYRFSINLARVNQDPWDAGTQYYSLILTSIKDSDESYSSASLGIQVKAPLYKMDILTGNTEGTNSAWGTKDYAYFYQDYNGFDLWKKLRVDYCYAGTSISGVSGSGSTCPSSNNVLVAFGDFWHDGTLGAAESFNAKSGYAVEIYRKTVDATGAITYLPVFHDTPATECTAITTGDVTGTGMPSVICGGANGWVWYYANNGNWTKVYVDQPTSGVQINSIVVGDFNGDGWNDIAVGGNGGYLKWYPNLGYGRFQNTGISDNWFAAAEETLLGSKVGGSSYLNTYVQDGSYEQLQEGSLNIPIQNGTTTDTGMNNTLGNWTFLQAYATATGQIQPAGGNPGAYAQISTTFGAGRTVGGYWYQPFGVTGSSPYTVQLTSLNYDLTTYGAPGGGAVTFYAFVDTTPAAPTQVPTNCVSSGSGACWTSGPLTGVTSGWVSLASAFAITGRVTAPGTYYLKVAMYSTYQSSGSSSVGGFDNVALSWRSTPGTTSALQQYWRMAQLPSRLGTVFTFNLYGHETGGNTAPDYDNFTIAYSTNVVGNDPSTGTYTTMFTVTYGTNGADANYQFALPPTVAGKVVWIRAMDTNRVVGDSNLDSLFVDYMYINANTPAGTTGVTLSGPTSNVNMIDAQDANGDGFSDLVAGTSGGNVWKYTGSAGGLLLAGGGAWYSTGGAAIVGVKWGNFSTNYNGLEIAVAFGTTVRIIRGDVAGQVVETSLPAFSPSSTITAFAVGDINGDGWDDVVIGTSGGGLFLWENMGQGTAWTYAVQIDNTGVPIYSLVVGDSANSAYMGR